MNIVITRSIDQTRKLSNVLKEQGHTLFCLPTFDIKPCVSAPINFSKIAYDTIIFFSVPAVIHAPLALKQSCAHLPVFAVGKSTAEQLKKEGFHRVDYPKQDSSSEHLLELDALKHAKNQRILLIQGQDGRDLVFDRLAAQENSVERCTVYKRCPITLDLEPILILWKHEKIHALIITSETSFDGLKTQLPADLYTSFLATPLIVISERLKKVAELQGYQTIHVAHSIEPADLIPILSTFHGNSHV